MTEFEAAALGQIPFFSRLPPEELERLAAEMGVLELPAGAVLFRAGDPGDLERALGPLQGFIRHERYREAPHEAPHRAIR